MRLRAGGRGARGDVELMAVSKTFPAEVIAEAAKVLPSGVTAKVPAAQLGLHFRERKQNLRTAYQGHLIRRL